MKHLPELPLIFSFLVIPTFGNGSFIFNSDNCNTSIVNFHRSCPNPECSYDLCLNCCQELRKGIQPGGKESESSLDQFVERSNGQDPPNNFPEWTANTDGSIPCPPKPRGGCGTRVLVLRRIFEPNWVHKLINGADFITSSQRLLDDDASQGCSLCLPTCTVRRAALRENSHDNYLYCPGSVDLMDTDFEHFQMHWRRGEPVIVRNVLANTSGLSWEPMVMWRAFRNARKKLKEETFCVKAIDCFDWCQVGIFNLILQRHVYLIYIIDTLISQSHWLE